MKITITDEAVPVQVDGEAWMQPPGIIQIVHKNRSPMLMRDRVCSLLVPFNSVLIFLNIRNIILSRAHNKIIMDIVAMGFDKRNAEFNVIF